MNTRNIMLGFVVGTICAAGAGSMYMLSTLPGAQPDTFVHVDAVPRTAASVVEAALKTAANDVGTQSLPAVQNTSEVVGKSTAEAPLLLKTETVTCPTASAQADSGAPTDQYFSHVIGRIEREACKNIAILDRDKAWLAGCHVAHTLPLACTQDYVVAKYTLDSEKLEIFMKTCACDISEEFGIILEQAYARAVSRCMSEFK